jgi:hypothetical protein
MQNDGKLDCALEQRRPYLIASESKKERFPVDMQKPGK